MRVLVCGGRIYNDRTAMWAWLDAYHAANKIDVIIHGAAQGADRLAGLWAVARGVNEIKFPAEWVKYEEAAGPIRNQQMIDEGRVDTVVAFKGGKGTASMVKLARDAGLKILEVKE